MPRRMWTPPDLPTYAPPPGLGAGLRAGHLQTVIPALFRRVDGVDYARHRLELPDGDFLDLDRLAARADGDDRPDGPPTPRDRLSSFLPSAHSPSPRVVLIAHGLEGSSDRAYVRGMARAFARRGWDAVAWNHRGCSGEPNRLLRAYHSGATEDLAAVVDWARGVGYGQIGLVGFSLGGNVTLKYVGDRGRGLASEVVGAVGISVPVDLASSAETMSAWDRRAYMKRFIRSLALKAEEKAARFPDAPDPAPIRAFATFAEFDAHVTAPLHGFESAEDYWEKCSALPVLRDVRVPTLLANARNDPFLSRWCYPATENGLFALEAPASGGHVGFVGRPLDGELWSETVAARWLEAAADYASSEANCAAPSSTA